MGARGAGGPDGSPSNGTPLEDTRVDTLVDSQVDGELSPRDRPGRDDPADLTGRLTRGDVIGRYVVLDVLGAGAMGVVYSAYDPDLDRRLAIKVLATPSTPTTDVSAAERSKSAARTRLIREAQAMARLTHPNVVTVHDVGTFGGQVFVAMEHVEGSTLGGWLDAHRRSIDSILAMFIQAGRGLAAAHQQGIVHRDFKPDNVLIGVDGRARVGDFGIAQQRDVQGRVLPATHGDASRPALTVDALREMLDTGSFTDVDTSSQLTEVGARIGTPAYMAPEQHLGQTVDARADQFAFCVALWEAVFRERPFGGQGSVLALSYNVCCGNLRPPPAGHDVPAAVRKAIERGLRPDPAQRHPSMEALLSALEPAPPRRGLIVGISSLAALAALGLGVWAARPDPLATCEAGMPDAEVWDADARGRLRERFAASGSPNAETAADRTIAELDDYRARWSAGWVAACEATHVDAAQSTELLAMRQACLTRRHDAFAALVDVLADAPGDADVDQVHAAVEAVSSLPRFEHCADASALLADIPPPAPNLSREVGEARRRLDRARALLTAARVDEALALAASVHGELEGVDYPPVRAEALFVWGRAAAEASDLELGREKLEQAATAAVALRHDALLGEISNELIAVVGERQSNYDAGFAWARVAEGLAARQPGSEHEATFRRTMCFVVADTGKADEAMPHCDRAVTLAEARFGPEHPATADALRAHGKALMVAGEPERSLARFEEAHRVIAGAFGADHPKATSALGAVAVGQYLVGRHDEARDTMARAVAGYESTLGWSHELTAINRNNLAAMELELGHVAAAHDLAERSLEALEAGFGPTGHPGIGASAALLGDTARASGDAVAAEAAYRRAVAVYVSTRGGETHPDVIATRKSLAELLVADARYGDAIEVLEPALDAAMSLDEGHPRVAEVRTLLTRARSGHSSPDRLAAAPDELP